jgi:hypothetical protein
MTELVTHSLGRARRQFFEMFVIIRLDGQSLAAQSKAFLNKLPKTKAFAQWPPRLLLHRQKGFRTEGSQAQSAKLCDPEARLSYPRRESDRRSITMVLAGGSKKIGVAKVGISGVSEDNG